MLILFIYSATNVPLPEIKFPDNQQSSTPIKHPGFNEGSIVVNSYK